MRKLVSVEVLFEEPYTDNFACRAIDVEVQTTILGGIQTRHSVIYS